MATILLSAAGAALGGSIGGSAFGISTAVLGRAIGATVGRVVDQRLLGGGSEVIETGKIERFQLTGASEGTAVGVHYGRVRTGGQVIWASRFREKKKTDSEETGGKGGGGTTVTTVTYSYSISLAIALCEGDIQGVSRIWADGVEISRKNLNMRVYTGTEEQLPDPKIVAVEGAANAPAYRGLAYVVFENLSLAQFGNRVPQFSFEVVRATDPELVPESDRSLSQTVRAVALIPGTGEYSLATTKVRYANPFGWSKTANAHSKSGKSDFSTSLDQLKMELPNCDSVSLVVSWFGDDLRCGRCQIKPKVEQASLEGNKMSWSVSGLTRDEAELVPKIDGRPVYGGTPTDQSVVEAVKALNASGKSVVFYPFILMEQLASNALSDPWSDALSQPAFPWRGRITTEVARGRDGSSDGTSAAKTEVANFFGTAKPGHFHGENRKVSYSGTSEWSFRRFILHYAELCALAGGVDAFCIGSEMRGLTQIRGAADSFPAVDELVALAADVRSILGSETKIGYAADWSEYFGYHPDDGSGDVFFHLDPLWACDDIDFVGIDNYMPLSDWRDSLDQADAEWKSIYNLDYLKANIEGGEGFDWYYANEAGRNQQERLPITDGAYGEPWVYRYKDIRNWWGQPHHDRKNGTRSTDPTAWIPQSKPIWFTEIGCAAIDKGTNQPNEFVDPKSSESQAPWFSNGLRDDLIQMQYLRAVCQYWSDPELNPISALYEGAMVDVGHTHVWAWDARPYPDFPKKTGVWSDGENYTQGHWLNGRASSETLSAVVSDICGRSGVREVDVSQLYGIVRGYSVNDTNGARASLQPLELAYGFDGSEREGQLSFRNRTGIPDFELTEETLVSDGKTVLSQQRGALGEAAGVVRANYIRADASFETRSAEASLPEENEQTASATDLAMCLTATESRRIVERWLAESRVGRDTATFTLPPSQMAIQAGDVVSLNYGDREASYRIDRIEAGEAQKVEAVRVEPDMFRPSKDIDDNVAQEAESNEFIVVEHFLDLPLLTGDEDPVAPYVAVAADPWPSSVAVYSSSEDDGYSLNCLIDDPAIVGATETVLPSADPSVPDLGPPLSVKIGDGVLSSASRTALLNGANALAIGDGSGEWEIMQFGEAVLVDTDTYELSYRLRGLRGTDAVMPTEWPEGSVIVLLDGTPTQIELPTSARGLERHYRVGPSDEGYGDDSFNHVLHTASSVGLRPYSPVHLTANDQGDGSIELSWIRRTRVEGDSWEGLDVPLGEDTEKYLVQVLDDDELVREIQVDEPIWHYSAETRAADALSGTVAFQVAQLSERYGAGPFQRIEINE